MPSGAGWGSAPGWSATPPAPAYPIGPASAIGQVSAIGPASATGHPTTVSGQASAPPVRSRSGLWIALTALVAGGGITAAVVAGRGPSDPGAVTPTGPASPPQPTQPAPSSPNSAAYRSLLQPWTPAPLAAGQWVTFHVLAFPGWDPRSVDVDGFLAWANRTAKQIASDAALVRIDVSNVYPDGHADLTLSSSGFVSVRFQSPSRGKRDPSVPLGAQASWHCMFQIMATVQTGPIITPMDGSSCEAERPQPFPRCSLRGVWQQMIAKQAPSGNAVAQLDYFSSEQDKPALWYASIAGAFSARFPDACP
jgi:hypothetical protein